MRRPIVTPTACPHCGVYDGALFWQRPDCAGRWHRFPEGHSLRERAEGYVDGGAP